VNAEWRRGVVRRERARRLDQVFGALADPTRRAILERLASGAASVTELAGPFGISLPAVSKHIRVLERSGLVRRRVAGRTHYLALDSRPLAEADGWLARARTFWQERLDEMERVLEERERPRGKTGHGR
jgi:DNA-binding transcriptional ArsR family regulator